MGKQFEKILAEHKIFINNQKIFFVATSPNEGKINLSPKGLDSFKILDDNKIIWLNLTGSANETAAHLIENNRMTIMFCSFDETPLILRLFGKAKNHYAGSDEFNKLNSYFNDFPGKRQIIEMQIDLVQTSCGWGVPQYTFNQHRNKLIQWAEDKGDEGIKNYWQEKNKVSLDNKPTGL